MSTELQRTCPSCGNELSGAVEFCPVCMLRKALAGEGECSESFAEDAVVPTSERMTQRFEHYELAKDEDGKPVELGRGAMGITYKAFDIDLRCAVTLKVINERNLRDGSARLRFLREARAAASVRHPNVASVFHLGKSGGNYFYAMEFVEGETLEGLIRRSGRLEVKLALEIAAQVTAGLTAIHKQKLVHRDIKPSNIMVNFEDEGAVTAKIIDLGLAKAVNEAGSQTAISMPGGFAGTPEFASPEQFAGVGTDIRSDLYSLGVMLWEMLTGHMLFRGSPAEVMHQHLPVTGRDVFGREEDVAFLNAAWANLDVNVVTIVAWAGVGKSTLVNHWLGEMAAEQYRSAQLVFGWSFYRQGSSGGTSSADEFLEAALNLVWRSRFADRNSVGEGRKIGQTDLAPSNGVGPGRLGAAPKSAWSTRRTASRSFPAGASARACCL
jgi:serine/threonine protein kinase